MLRRLIPFCLFSAAVIFCLGLNNVSGQGGGGKSNIKDDKPSGGKGGGKNEGKGGGNSRDVKINKPGNNRPTTTTPPKQVNPPPKPCEEGELVIRCGLPECSILIDRQSQGITNLSGEMRVGVKPGRRVIFVSKDGYEPETKTATVSCGESETSDIKLKPKPFEALIKTNVPDCDIFVNDALVGKSDKDGNFKYRFESGTALVEARKVGYQAYNKSVSPSVTAAPQKPILLTLKPMPARFMLTASGASGAYAYVEGDEKRFDLSEPFSLDPGRRKLIVSALGYAPQTLELDLQPNQSVKKTVDLKRLSVPELLAQAEQYFNKKSVVETIKLCNYVFESDPDNALANRLVGSIYLERQNYAEAEPRLLKALAGNETVRLDIRRHYNEKFEFSSGHDSCAGFLILTKTHIEYSGMTATGENFKVPYGQIQIAGLQVKKNAALHLSLKVANSKGGKKDYNFYAKDKELTQEGKAYLETIQRLIQRRM